MESVTGWRGDGWKVVGLGGEAVEGGGGERGDAQDVWVT